MSEQLTHVTGLAELQKFLDQLPAKVERNIARGALRAGANAIKPLVVSNIHTVSGELARSIKVGTRARGGRVSATIGTKVYYAKFVEFGTRPHTITARDRGHLAVGGLFFQSVDHPGTKPRAFLRPALDAKRTEAVVTAGEYIKARLATKHGLDTSYINIEGDE